MKRIVDIYKWYGKEQDEANKALGKLFGDCGKSADLERGAHSSIIQQNAAKRKKSIKIEPEKL